MTKPKNKGEMAKIFGERLRLIREARGMTLSDLAWFTDISQSFLSEIERGQREPNLELIEKFSSVLAVHRAAFFQEELWILTELHSFKKNYGLECGDKSRSFLKELGDESGSTKKKLR